jgi:hypothetical protein
MPADARRGRPVLPIHSVAGNLPWHWLIKRGNVLEHGAA